MVQKLKQYLNEKQILYFLGIYLFMTGIFIFSSIGTQSYRLFLHMRQFLPAALSATISIWYWVKDGYRKRALIPYIIVGLSWSLIHNILSYKALYGVATNLNNYKDVMFGAYIFGFLVLLRVFAGYWIKKTKILDGIFSVLQVLLLLIPLVETVYFKIYGTVISTTAATALLQTNPKEAKEYLLQNIGMAGVVGILIGLLIIFVIFFHLNQGQQEKKNFLSAKSKIIAAILLIAIGIYLPSLWKDTGVMNSIIGAGQYLASSRKFAQYHKENFQKLQVNLPSHKFSKPSTIILVVGESAGRNFMSVYGYSKDTTPWWRQSVANDPQHFLRFNHAYSSFGSTVQALERALTEKNQYNNKSFSQSLTILDLAKKAGYKTYWFSNQSVKNSADTPIQLVARTADVHEWIDELPENQGKMLYDGDLLPCLKKVNPNENNFVVLHVMGSHELTQHRYPPSFARFSKNGQFDLVANYEDSMAYDDWVMEHIFNYAKQNLNLQAMVFFSDHGANPYHKRMADNVPFINLRIPLLIYFSDEYIALYPETVKILRTHENQYFTNDLLYELIGGVLQVKSNHIPEQNNFSSAQYIFTRDTLKTDLGRKNIRDDVNENFIPK